MPVLLYKALGIPKIRTIILDEDLPTLDPMRRTKFNTKEDFAYFLLFAMEQNGVSGQDTPVSFSGLIRPASDIIDLCGRYVKDLRFVEDPHALQMSKPFEKVPFQYYFILYQALR